MKRAGGIFKKIWQKKCLVLICLFVFTAIFSVSVSAVTEDYRNARTDAGFDLTDWFAANGKNGIGFGTETLIGLQDSQGNQISSGVFQPLTKLSLSMTIIKPISSIDYLAYLKENLGVEKPTYAAQGTGFTILEPILKIWIICRNVCYLFFIVIFLTIGLMVLFRTKINPQTVISIENALPKIIVSLLLVTFSYAIFAFMIDIAYLGNYLLKNIFANNLTPTADTPFYYPIEEGGFQTTWQDLPSILNMLDGTGALGKLTTGLTNIAGLVAGDWTGVLELVLAFTLVSTVIKIFFSLLTSYITLILTAILSPFAFLWNALPGQQDTGPKIIKTALSKALVFPAMAFMINLAFYFSNPDLPNTVLNFKTIPPLHPNVPLESQTLAFRSLIALGVLMATAQLPAAIDDALAIKPSALGGGGQDMAGALRKIPIIGSLAG